MVSLRRGVIKSRRSLTRAVKEVMTLPAPVSKVPIKVRVKLADKIRGAAKRLYSAEKRLHTSGMPKARAKVVMAQAQFKSESLGFEKGRPVTRTTYLPISKGHDRARAKRQKEELNLSRKRFS